MIKTRVRLVAHVARIKEGKEKCVQDFGGGNLKKRDYIEDLDIDGRILNWIVREIGRKHVEWIDLAQNRNKWRAVVNTVMKLQVP
jgi:hypothetical protein